MKARSTVMLLLLALASLAALSAVAYQTRAAHQATAPKSLTAYVPQGALLSIESPDFASLLRRWRGSAESKRWMASDNFAVFQNSRLFGRLSDAQASFAKAAGVPAGTNLLKQVAGKESVFAWYDIGKLEFLYITRMPSAESSQSELLQARGSFQRRHAGNADFYMRSSGGELGTVAFAQVSSPSGDLLILATRQDLMANALMLMAAASPMESIGQELWFRDASAALPAEETGPALHMVLNLDRIAHDPHFQTYWIQGNITWMRQFRAAVADLYMERYRFREERALVRKSTAPETDAGEDISSLAALTPVEAGVFRATSTQDPGIAISAVKEKLLGADEGPAAALEDAPDPSLEAAQSGSASDLEVRIDAPPPVSKGASTEALARACEGAAMNGVLTLSSAQAPGEKDGLWVPIHSAVALRGAKAWDAPALAAALQEALRGSLTAASIGIEFHAEDAEGVKVYALSGPRTLFFTLASAQGQGNLAMLSDDRPLLLELVHNVNKAAPAAAAAVTSMGGFNHATQRGPFLRLTSLIDGTNKQATASTGPKGAESAAAPAFFSRNLGSLSESFAVVESERVVERKVEGTLRQTVTYAWSGAK